MKLEKVNFMQGVRVPSRGVVQGVSIEDATNPRGPKASIEMVDNACVCITIAGQKPLYVPRENVSDFTPLVEEKKEEKKVEPPKK